MIFIFIIKISLILSYFQVEDIMMVRNYVFLMPSEVTGFKNEKKQKCGGFVFIAVYLCLVINFWITKIKSCLKLFKFV